MELFSSGIEGHPRLAIFHELASVHKLDISDKCHLKTFAILIHSTIWNLWWWNNHHPDNSYHGKLPSYLDTYSSCSDNSHQNNSPMGQLFNIWPLPAQAISANGNSHMNNSDPDNVHQYNSQLGIVRVRVVQVEVFSGTKIGHFKTDFIRRFVNFFFA